MMKETVNQLFPI